MDSTLQPDRSWPRGQCTSQHPILNEDDGSASRWDRADFLHIATDLYAEQQQRWLNCKARTDLLSTLDAKAPPQGWHIRNAVCLAVGAIFSDNPIDLRNTPRQLFQLACFMDIVDHLQHQLPLRLRIRLYVQDPVLTTRSQTFLESLSIAVLHRPHAEDLIAVDTFSFAPGYAFDYTYLGRCRIRQPVLAIGISFDTALSRSAWIEGVNAYGNEARGPAVELDQVPRRVRRDWKMWAMLRTFKMTHETFRICDTEEKYTQAAGICQLYLSVERHGASCARALLEIDRQVAQARGNDQ
ncbi:unnamed protein product [Zymoseptoria tritici ST99CH_1A5]|uniref:SRR1-like domain-containing protein n=2 Tax=Zymoseptoria tritici TaxID=1047171 RepID=A0A2H1G3G4_ZYMTR|nr:unnamed protein product [Zymoseptoria tritici ST99CH_1E4]SMY22006.1 unnamed protein product [Zymoseptoria tritici ST99CH_1A5]